MSLDEQRRKCPYCAEWIMPEAIVCRYCRKEIPALVAVEHVPKNERVVYPPRRLNEGDRVPYPQCGVTRTLKIARILAGIAIVLLIGICIFASGSMTPVVYGHPGFVTHDTTFYPGHDIESAIGALVGNQLLGDVGGLCDQGINCEGRQTIKAGTDVQVLEEVTMQNDRLDVAFDHVKNGTTEGWILASAVR